MMKNIYILCGIMVCTLFVWSSIELYNIVHNGEGISVLDPLTPEAQKDQDVKSPALAKFENNIEVEWYGDKTVPVKLKDARTGNVYLAMPTSFQVEQVNTQSTPITTGILSFICMCLFGAAFGGGVWVIMNIANYCRKKTRDELTEEDEANNPFGENIVKGFRILGLLILAFFLVHNINIVVSYLSIADQFQPIGYKVITSKFPDLISLLISIVFFIFAEILAMGAKYKDDSDSLI
jgi:hypothetical protein